MLYRSIKTQSPFGQGKTLVYTGDVKERRRGDETGGERRYKVKHLEVLTIGWGITIKLN